MYIIFTERITGIARFGSMYFSHYNKTMFKLIWCIAIYRAETAAILDG